MLYSSLAVQGSFLCRVSCTTIKSLTDGAILDSTSLIGVLATAPTAVASIASLSDDTGASSTYSTVLKTINGTYTGTIETNKTLRILLDNGANWSDATTAAGNNGHSPPTPPTTTDNTLAAVFDSVGNASTAVKQTVTLDTLAPTANFTRAVDDAGLIIGLLTDVDTTDFTVTGDTTAPEVATFLPVYNETNVALDSDITITFNENIQLGRWGTITVSDGTNSMNYLPSSGGPNLYVSANTLTINPTDNLLHGTDDTIVLVGNDSSDIIGRGNGAIKDTNYLVHNW